MVATKFFEAYLKAGGDRAGLNALAEDPERMQQIVELSPIVKEFTVWNTVQLGGFRFFRHLCALAVRKEKRVIQSECYDALLRSTIPLDTEMRMVPVVQATCADFGLPNGVYYEDVLERALKRGLLLCPLELALHAHTQHFFADASVTGIFVASAPIEQLLPQPCVFVFVTSSGKQYLTLRKVDGATFSKTSRFLFVHDSG